MNILSTNTTLCKTFPLQLNGGITVDENSQPIGVEGDFCNDNYDCSSFKCESYFCVADNKLNCLNTTTCSSDSYCNITTQICTPRKENGLSCQTDDNCLNTSGCYNNICTPFFSFPAGTKINTTEPRDLASRFCISNWTNQNYTCEDLLNDGDAPYNCQYGVSDCSYTTSITKQTVYLKESCNCDIMTSVPYCKLGTNTVEWLTYINALLNNWWFPCHYYNKGYCNKIPMLSNYYLFNSTLALYGISPLNQNYLSCLAPPTIPSDVGYCQDDLGNGCLTGRKNSDSVLMKLSLYKVLSLIILLII